MNPRDAVKKLVGDPETVEDRVLPGVALVSISIAAAGLIYTLLIRGIEAGGASSLPYLEPVMQYATSPWILVLLVVFLGRAWLTGRRKREARTAATATGRSPRTVKRLSMEASRASGCTRSIITSEDDVESARDRIETALDGDADRLEPTGVTDSEGDESGGESLSSDSEGEHDTASWSQKMKEKQLDVAATLDIPRVIWGGVIPAVTTIAALLIAVQIWVAPIVYPFIFIGGVGVGAGNLWRHHVMDHRRIDSLEDTANIEEWDQVAVLAKTVETPDSTVYIGWLRGTAFAHYSKTEFSHGLAVRACETTHGDPVSPSIMTQYARNLQQMYPDLHGYLSNEREQIIHDLLDEVQGSDMGMIPRQTLIENTVEKGIKNSATGRIEGDHGHDPQLVAECYRALVPAALVEEDMEIDRDGESRTIPSVRLRTDPVPLDFGELQAQFSYRFGSVGSPRYPVPDTGVDDIPEWAESAISEYHPDN